MKFLTGGLFHSVLSETGGEKFQCRKCSKLFNKKSSLSAHVSRNCDKPKFACYICFKKFTRVFTLKFHIKQVHAININLTASNYRKMYGDGDNIGMLGDT